MKKIQMLTTVSALAVVVFGSAANAQDTAPAAPAEVAVQAPPPDASDQVSPDDFTGLDEIVVTARRVEENLQRVPVAVVALSAETLEQRNVVATNDLQFSIPNLQVKPSNTYPSQPEFIMRGQRQVLLTDENVVTYVNGVAQSTRGLTYYDLQSVQALKGPQGTLFGRNSMGGAMVFTTQRPTFETEASVQFELGNYERTMANVMLNIPIEDEKVALRVAGQIERQDGFFKNLSPGQKNLNDRKNESGRATLLIKPSDTFENIATIDYIHRDEVPTPSLIEAAPLANNFFRSVTQQAVTQQSALGGATPFIDTEKGLLVRRGNPFRSGANTHFGDTLIGAAYPALSHYATKSDVWGIGNTSSFEVSDTIMLKNIIGYRYEKAYDHQDPSGLSGMTFDLGPLFGAPAGLIFGQSTNNDTYYLNRSKTWSDEFQIIGKMDNFDFIAGAFYSHRKHLYAVNSTFVVGPASFYGPRPVRHAQMDDKAESTAVFAQGTYDFSEVGLEGVRLTAGVRYTWDKKSYVTENFFSTSNDQLQDFALDNIPQSACNQLNATEGNAVAINDGIQCQLSNHRTYKKPTWTASLEWQATSNTLLYLASRRGFKAGGPNPTTRSLQYGMFGSENITDFELGLKQQGELGTVPYRLNIAAFYGEYKQIQTQDILQFCSNPAADPSNAAACGVYTDLIILNLGKATVKGIELEATIKPFPILQFDFGYSYQKARYGSGSIVPQPVNPALPIADSNPINFDGGVDLDGEDFAGMPRTNLNVAATLDADFIPESFAKTQLSVNYYYRSSTEGIPVQGIYQTPSFGTLGGRLSFNELFGSDFSLAFWGSNITNERYKLNCSNNLNSIGYASCKWGDPRTYGMTVSATF